MARQYFKPKQSSIPETYKGYEINFGYLLNGQPAWEGFDKNKNIGIFGPIKPALHYFLNYRCPLQCCPYAGHFQRGRLQAPLFDVLLPPPHTHTHITYVDASGNTWASETETTTFGKISSLRMC